MDIVTMDEALEKIKCAASDEHAVVLVLAESYKDLKYVGGIAETTLKTLEPLKGLYKHQHMLWVSETAGSTVIFNTLSDEMRKFSGIQATHIFILGSASDEQVSFLTSRLRSAKYKGEFSITLVK